MKKFVAILVTGVMLLSLCVTAFAATPATTATEKSESLTVGAVTAVPNIKVTMPKLGKNPVVINPYKLTYSQQVNGADVLEANKTKQVISPVYNIKNESDVPLGLDVTVTGTVAGAFALVQPTDSVTTDTVQTSEKNEAIVKLLVQANVATPTTDGAAFSDLVEAGTAPNADSETKLYDADAVVPIVLDKKAVKAGGTLTCNKPAVGSDGAVTPNNICFQFVGAAASNPKTAWTAADSLTAAIVFSFKPITLASSTSTTGD